MRNIGKSRQSKSNNRGLITKSSEEGIELDKESYSPKQIHLEGNRQVHAILQGIEKSLC